MWICDLKEFGLVAVFSHLQEMKLHLLKLECRVNGSEDGIDAWLQRFGTRSANLSSAQIHNRP